MVVYTLVKKKEDEKPKKKGIDWKKVGAVGEKALEITLKAGETVAKTSMKLGERMCRYGEKNYTKQNTSRKRKKKKEPERNLKKKRVIIEYG